MKYSISGLITASLLTLTPFFVSSRLFYGETNPKLFLIIFVIDILLFTLGYLILAGRADVVLKKRWLLTSLVLFMGVQYMASFSGVFPEKSLWSDILRSTGIIYITHIVLFATVLGALLNKNDWMLVRRGVIFSAATFSLLSIVGSSGFGFEGVIGPIDFSKEALTVGNTTFAGVYLFLSFVLGVIEFVRSKREVMSTTFLLIALVVTAISPILLRIKLFWNPSLISSPIDFLGSARASSATLFVFLFFLLGIYIVNRFVSWERLRRNVKISWAVLLLLGIIFANTLLFVQDSFVQKAYVDTSTSARIIVWNTSLNAVTERPLLGWGPENFYSSFERHFDNRLFLKENFGEVWFDRAHNIYIDTLVTTGAIGLVALIVLLLTYVVVVYRAYRKGLIGELETTILIALVPLHLLQLQTGFDTVTSYLLLGVLGGYVLSLERNFLPTTESNKILKNTVAVILIIGSLVSLKFFLYDELVRQRALITSFAPPEGKQQKELIELALSRSSDREGLRLASASFIKGSLFALARIPKQEDYLAYARKVLDVSSVFDRAYQKYLNEYPEDYRIRMNYAYLLLIETTLGNTRLEDAREIVVNSYNLSPNNPITYGLHAVIELYGGNIEKANGIADAMLNLNPDIELSKAMHAYVQQQIRDFPNITVLKLENL